MLITVRTVGQEISSHVFKSKFHYRVHKSRHRSLSQDISTQTNLKTCFPKMHFKSKFHSRLCFSTCLFASVFPTKILYIFFISPIRATSPAHPSILCLTSLIVSEIFSPASCHFILLSSKCSPKYLFSVTLDLCPSLNNGQCLTPIRNKR
jgi:hypothetical protein